MATKSYSKHKEYKEFKSNAPAPYTDEQFDMLKSELIPKGSKLEALARSSGGAGSREYHYEYKEEKLPAGKYDRKDLRTVEEYTIPAQTVPKAESASYYYEREERELPAITNGTRTYNYESSTSSTPGYSRIKSSKATKELSHNVEELDSLLDDLQKDQERQLYKSGYTSDTAESTSFDYRRGTPVKAPSSGYSTLKKEERVETSSWGGSPPPPLARTAELRQEMYREEKTESRVVPAPAPAPAPAPHAVSPLPPAVCTNCHTHTASSTGTLTRSSTPMNKVTTTVKTYTYEIPADVDPVTIATPPLQKTTTVTGVTSAPGGGCQYCSHCNSTIREYTHVSTKDEHTNERVVYPTAVNETRHVRSVSPARPPAPVDQRDGHTPYGPSTYKYSETTYSSQNTTERFPLNSSVAQLPPPAPFPRPATPNPGQQQPPKRLDDLMADFPEARFPTEPDGLHHRKVEVTHERSTATSGSNGTKPAPPVGTSKNIAGPAVYYPPGHTPFQNKEVAGYQASSMQGGGAYASGRGMYEYESGSKSKEKHSEKKTAVPICLPLCCAMPCVIM